MKRCALVGLLVTGFLACADDPAPAPPPANVAPEGGAPEESLVTTTEEHCPAGSRAAVGTTSCVPVGTTTCAPGFAKDDSGWGCAAVLPSANCTGATRPALGETSCVPVGDCSAAFPPAGAIIVDPTLADGAVDATHVKTLTDALTAATDGATIALVDGEHVTPFALVSRELTIVGRCAEKTKLLPDAGTGGMRISSKVKMRGVTVSGMETAFEITTAGGAFDLEDAVVEASRGRAIFPRNSATTTMRRVVVRGTVAKTPGAQTIAVLVGNGAELTIEDSAITDSFDGALVATDATGGRVTMKRTVIDGTTSSAVRVFEGAKLDMQESVVRGAKSMALLVLHQKSGTPEAIVTRSVIDGVEPAPDSPDEDIGTAVNAAYGGIVNIDDSSITNTRGIGVFITQKAKATLTNSVVRAASPNEVSSGVGATASRGAEITMNGTAIVDAHGIGLGAVDHAIVRMERSLIGHVGGKGVTSSGLSVGFGLNVNSGSTVDFVDSSIVDAFELGIGTDGVDTRITLDKALLRRTSDPTAADYGHGILCAYEAITDVRGSVLEGHRGAALFYAGGGGAVTRTIVRANAIGAHVQEGSTLTEAESTPETSAVPDLVITSDVQFVDNTSKTGTGELPLPGLAVEP